MNSHILFLFSNSRKTLKLLNFVFKNKSKLPAWREIKVTLSNIQIHKDFEQSAYYKFSCCNTRSTPCTV